MVLDEATLDNMEDGYKPIWIFDIKDPANPALSRDIAHPVGRELCRGRRPFRPAQHLRESAGPFRQLGHRLHDLPERRRARLRHQEPVFACGGQALWWWRRRASWCDPRPNRPLVLHAADVFVDKDGLVYATDFSVGLYIMEYHG